MIWKRLACSRSRTVVPFADRAVDGHAARAARRCRRPRPAPARALARVEAPRVLGQAPALLHRHAHAGVGHLHDHPARGPAAARMARDPPRGMASTALWIRRTSASRSSRPLDGRQGLHVLGHRDDGAPCIRPRRASAATSARGPPRCDRGQAHRPVGGLGLARDELLQLRNRGGRPEGHVADHHEPPARRLRLASRSISSV
jgi:hypothetical protein